MEHVVTLCVCVLILALADAYTRSQSFTKEPALWSLRCIYAGEKKCNNALSEYDLPDVKDLTFPVLEETFGGMASDLQEAFEYRDLGRLSGKQVCQIPGSFLLLLPAEYLQSIEESALARLVECNVNNLAIVRSCAIAVQSMHDGYSFYNELQSMSLGPNVLSILGEEISSMSLINSASWLTSRDEMVLEYLSPNVILDENNKLIPFMHNMDISRWADRPQRVKRLWAYALKRYIEPSKFSDWMDSDLQSLGHLLVGSTVEELSELASSRIQNKYILFQSPFSVIQSRGVFDATYPYRVLNRAAYLQVSNSLHQLLPKHLQQFSQGSIKFSDHVHLNMPTSLATSRQIIEYVLHDRKIRTLRELTEAQEDFIALNQLIYSLPLNIFRNLNYTVSFKQLLSLQNGKISMAQLFYLTNRGDLYKLSISGIHGANEILNGVPTAIVTRTLPSEVYKHLMSNLPGTILPRSAALLDNFLFFNTGPGIEKYYRNIFSNPDARAFLNILPSKFVERYDETILQAIEHYIEEHRGVVNSIPEHVLSVLFTKTSNSSLGNMNSLNPIMLRGMTCSYVKQLTPLDFIHVMARFNTLRATYGWVFPKNLQQCCLNKFVEYLKMKSAFMTHYMSSSLTSLMTPSDIEAVGGFVLTGIPLTELRDSKVLSSVVRAIGKLSLPELLVAARTTTLIDLGELYYRPGMGKDLFNLGNLTSFLSVQSIRSVDPSDFKLMLESGYMDKRICGVDTQRDAWYNLILDAFGSTDKWEAQDLVTLGDMLMVIPYHDLSKVDPRVWADAADVLSKTNYLEMIEGVDMQFPFYQVCENSFSDSYEATTYRRDIAEFVGWLLSAAQFQLDTVVTAQALSKGQRMTQLSRPLITDFDQSGRSNDDNGNFLSSIFPFTTFSNNKRGNHVRISCDAVRSVGKPSELSITIGTIEDMGPEDVEDCKEEFGKMDLSKELSLHIWNKLNKVEAPHLAGKLLARAGPTEVMAWNLTFDQLWSHETLFYLTHYNQDNDTTSVLLKIVNNQTLTLLSLEHVISLGRLICHLRDATITPIVFFKASRYLGSTLPCDLECFQHLSSSFENEDAYGPIQSWTPDDVASLGVLIAGLDLEKWIGLVENPTVLSKLGTRALQCLPHTHLNALSNDAVKELPTTTATFLHNQFPFLLNNTVKSALEDHVSPTLDFQTPERQQIVYTWTEHRFVPIVGDASGASARASAFTIASYVVFLIFVISC